MTGFASLAAAGRVPTVILGLALGVVCGGCSALDPEGTRCGIPVGPPCVGGGGGTDGNGGGAGGGGGDPPRTAWSCLTDPYVSDIERPPGLGFAMVVVDFNNPMGAMAIPGLKIKVCQILDFPCVEPLPIPVMSEIPGRPPPLIAGGPFPYGFEGYLNFDAPGYLPTEYYFSGELGFNLDPWDGTPPTVVSEPISLPRELRINEFFQQLTGNPANRNTNSGIIALRTFNCLGQRAAGVSLELQTDTTGTEIPWVFAGGLPAAGTVTDKQGVAGFANMSLEMGNVIRVRGVTPNGTRYGDVAINVRPNTLTFAEVRPLGPYARTAPQ